ncbi:MAG: TlpA family protein disulfide reductase [Saprospiraceae bacterium]|jgi:thiol-disulfide isomerase/thioredoxin|nr:TlpA family protein disulfide reductase [Saprospiraceae bacterium]
MSTTENKISTSGSIFFGNGILLKTESISKTDNTKDTSEVYEIRKENCSCRQELEKLNFDFNLLDAKALVDLPFPVIKGKDYTIIEEDFRNLIQVQLYDNMDNKTTEEIFLGSYTLIDLWATWCQPCIYAMPALGDIYDKYRYDGLKVVSISLDGEPATEKWKKTIEREHIYWDNYIMPQGFDSDLCRQLDVKAIPRYILLDPEGRIMLENAPGPSDPNLTEIMDRLLKGKK